MLKAGVSFVLKGYWHLYFLSSVCLFLHGFCSKLFVCSTSLTRSGFSLREGHDKISCWNLGDAFKNSPITGVQQASRFSAAASVLPCEDPGTSSKASFLYMVKATMGGRKTEGQGRQLWFWRVTSYTNGMQTRSWYFTSFSLVAVSVEGRLLTENMDVSDSPLVLPALFMVSYQLVLQENSEGG